MFLSGTDNLRYNKIKTEIKNNWVVGMDGYHQEIPGGVNLLNK